jgi:competence protein ComEC
MQALKQTRGPLAAAVGALTGAGLFFALPFDPVWGWALVPAGLGLLVWVWRRWAGICLVVAGLAFGAAAWQVARVEAPHYAVAGRHAHWIVGQVSLLKENSDNPERVTLVLERPVFYQLAGMGGVKFANIGMRKSQAEGVKVSDFVAIQTILLPPEGETRRNGYDGRLWRYFNGDRVFGYAQGAVEVTYKEPQKPTLWGRWQADLGLMRAQILAASGGYADGVVAALLVNSEGQVPKQIRDAYRASGLSHILAVSGTQITVVAGGVFVLLRWLMVAAWPGLALRVNTKAWAGLGALLAAGVYTLLAGAGVTVVRAFIMAAIVIGAVVAGRVGNLLRIWCVAVVCMVLVDPVVVVQAGFQLSIAAVLALIVLGLVEHKPRNWLGWLKELVLASVMAGAATAAILVAHFGQLPLLTVVANVVATVPMMLATYFGFIGLVLLPFGGATVPWTAAGLLSGWVNDWALWLAKGGFATVMISPAWWPVVGLLSGCLMGGVLLRRIGLVMVGVGGVLVLAVWPHTLPEVVVWQGGEVGWVKEGEGYKLMWAEKPERALVGCAQALGATCSAGEGVLSRPDESLMPVTPLEDFAWAEKTKGVWQVEPVRCGRVWQRVGC